MNPLKVLRLFLGPVTDWVKDTVHGDDKAKGKRIMLLLLLAVSLMGNLAEGSFVWWLVAGHQRFAVTYHPKNEKENNHDGPVRAAIAAAAPDHP